MSTKNDGTLGTELLNTPNNRPKLPGKDATPEENLLYCQQMLAQSNEQLKRFMAIFGLHPLEVQRLEQIIRDISFYTNSSDTWRIIISTLEGQNDV